uniref:Importin N-terminal domain-containing protein n=1 Tax=Steinernema glaseri TaxID=37863 RepID=A0A1I8AN80_9BILA
MSRPITSSNSSQFPKKQLEWISSLIQRYQDQLPTNTGRPIDRETRQLLDTTHSCIINVSKNHLQMVVVSLVRVLKAVNASRWTSELALTQSRLIVMETLLECLQEAEGPLARRPEREACMGQLLEEMWQMMTACGPGSQVHDTATAIVARVGALYSTMMIAKLDATLEALKAEETPDETVEDALKHLSMMSHVTYVLCDVIKILNQVLAHYPVRKEFVEPVCAMLSSAMWKWIEANPDQFGLLQHSAHEQLSGTVTLYAGLTLLQSVVDKVLQKE